MISLNLSVVAANPPKDPKIKLGTSPNGVTPSNPAAAAPIPIAGKAFLTLSILSLLNTPRSPNNVSLTRSLFLANPNADPINKPPIAPTGVINPAIPPNIPNFLTSGKAFCIS